MLSRRKIFGWLASLAGGVALTPSAPNLAEASPFTTRRLTFDEYRLLIEGLEHVRRNGIKWGNYPGLEAVADSYLADAENAMQLCAQLFAICPDQIEIAVWKDKA